MAYITEISTYDGPYTSAFQHLNHETPIAVVKVLGPRFLRYGHDLEETVTSRVCLTIKRLYGNPTVDQIKLAIRQTFGGSHCSHEYDCCGCRSYYVSKIRKIKPHTWIFTVTSSRNF